MDKVVSFSQELVLVVSYNLAVLNSIIFLNQVCYELYW